MTSLEGNVVFVDLEYRAEHFCVAYTQCKPRNAMVQDIFVCQRVIMYCSENSVSSLFISSGNTR